MSISNDILVYHYEADAKFFLRTSRADLCPFEGIPLVPAFATLIAPPSLEIDGNFIAQFNESSKKWEMVSNNFWKPEFSEINYDAGRPLSTYAPISLSMYRNCFPPYPSIPMICNSALVVTTICQRVMAIHEKFDLICGLHEGIIENKLPLIAIDSPEYSSLSRTPAYIYRYKFEVESMVYLMRCVLDCLAQLTYLMTDSEEFSKTKRIAHNEIGRALEVSRKETDFAKIIVGDGGLYEEDRTGFLKIINELFNSFKHCLMHEESNLLICAERPSIVSYHAKHNDHKEEIIYHNHSAHHIIMGFQDNIQRIIKNQKQFLTVGSTGAPT